MRKQTKLLSILLISGILTGCTKEPSVIPPSVTDTVTESDAAAEISTDEAATTDDSADVTQTEASATTENMSVVAYADTFEDSWSLIRPYGFYDTAPNYSTLSFQLEADSLKTTDDYYEMHAIGLTGVTVPSSLSIGESYTICLTDTDMIPRQITIIKTAENSYSSDEGDEFYTFDDDSNSGEQALYEYSDDRVETAVLSVIIRIKKDAEHGIDILNEYRPLSPEDLVIEGEPYQYYNGVVFDEDGYVTKLVSIGD